MNKYKIFYRRESLVRDEYGSPSVKITRCISEYFGKSEKEVVDKFLKTQDFIKMLVSSGDTVIFERVERV